MAHCTMRLLAKAVHAAFNAITDHVVAPAPATVTQAAALKRAVPTPAVTNPIATQAAMITTIFHHSISLASVTSDKSNKPFHSISLKVSIISSSVSVNRGSHLVSVIHQRSSLPSPFQSSHLASKLSQISQRISFCVSLYTSWKISHKSVKLLYLYSYRAF